MRQKTSGFASLFGNRTINVRITIGFTVVLVFLALCGTGSVIGINRIIANAHEVVSGHELYLTLTEREVDHLNWAGKVTLFLTDPSVAKLEVETDDHKCKLGKWLYGEERKKAETIVWNGPLGLFEDRPYDQGTLAIARVVAARSKGHSFGVVGGGETVVALKRTQTLHWVDHVSTGGGAMLEYLGGAEMPGISALEQKRV